MKNTRVDESENVVSEEKKPETKTRDFYTLEEAAEICRVPKSTLYKRISEGLLVASKPGRSLVIDAKELQIFMKRTRVTKAS